MKHLMRKFLMYTGCFLFCFQVFAQEKEITGTIVDASGMPIPGVNIVVSGTTSGTQSNFDGEFSLTASQGDVLVFTFMGLETLEVTIGADNSYDVVMQQDDSQLEEVVVVGYGSQKERSITSAVATMDSDAIENRPINRVDQALIGQMSGVRVQQTSGVPGAAFNIQVRGTGSISASDQPLYVVDGFPLDVSSQNSGGGFSNGNPLDNINPNDIESIQVLKDASAAAIYGSRGANGVVIITTKTGKTGAPRISLNVSSGVSQAEKKLDVLSGEEWIDRAIEMVNYNWVNSGEGRTADQTSAEREAINGSFNNQLILDERWLDPNHEGLVLIDWQDEIFRTGIMQNYQATASGGTENVKYYISGDYLDQEGVAVGLDYKRYSARANVEVQVNDKLSFGLNVSPSFSIANDPGVEGKDQQMHIASGMTPVQEANVGLDVNTGDNIPYQWGVSRNSPLRVIQNSVGKREIFRTLATLNAEYDILNDLVFRSTINLDHTDMTDKSFRPSFVSGQRGGRQASGSYNGYRRQTFVNENTLSYNRVFNDLHDVSLLGGISYNFGKISYFNISSAGGFGSDDITTLNAANNISSGSGTSESQHAMMSYFSRAQYSFADKYLVSGTIRRDGSSRFGEDTRWGIFPSFSAGWRVSEEPFMDNLNAIEDLKLRASWGVSGNSEIGNYSHIAMLGFSNYSFGGNLVNGQVPTNFPNPNLGWEESETYNFGLDLSLFKNRIVTSFDYYTKTNKNLLLSIPVPTATGFSSALTNIGEVDNWGWEFELTTRNLTGEFTWTTNFNLTHNENEVKKLGPDNNPIYSGAHDQPHKITTVGEPINSFYVIQRDGILTQEDLDNGAPLVNDNQTVGDPKYLDANGDGIISYDDRVLSGDPNPDYIYGITNTFGYKNFDLRILVQGQTGGYLYSLFGRGLDRTGMGLVENTLGVHRNRWRSPENPGSGERGKANSNFGFVKSTDWLYKTDYWRIRNITLGYNFDDLLEGSNILSGARLYASAENWFGDDEYDGGYNPEARNYNGDDYGAFPLSKTITIGLNLTF